MRDQVPVNTARERNRILRNLAAEKKRAFMQPFVGKTVDAITLNLTHRDRDSEVTEALTDNYLKIFLNGQHEPNRWVKAQVLEAREGALLGIAV